MRPVKKALVALDNPDLSLTEEERMIHARQCLVSIGNQIDQCVSIYKDPEAIKEWKNRLWYFVSKFTEYDSKKLHKLYRHALKKKVKGIKESEDGKKSEKSKESAKRKLNAGDKKGNDEHSTPAKKAKSESAESSDKNSSSGKSKEKARQRLDSGGSVGPSTPVKDAEKEREHNSDRDRNKDRDRNRERDRDHERERDRMQPMQYKSGLSSPLDGSSDRDRERRPGGSSRYNTAGGASSNAEHKRDRYDNYQRNQYHERNRDRNHRMPPEKTRYHQGPQGSHLQYGNHYGAPLPHSGYYPPNEQHPAYMRDRYHQAAPYGDWRTSSKERPDFRRDYDRRPTSNT